MTFIRHRSLPSTLPVDLDLLTSYSSGAEAKISVWFDNVDKKSSYHGLQTGMSSILNRTQKSLYAIKVVIFCKNSTHLKMVRIFSKQNLHLGLKTFYWPEVVA